MKIKISYTESERERADKLAELYLKHFKDCGPVVITRSDRYKPFYHIYIADNNKCWFVNDMRQIKSKNLT